MKKKWEKFEESSYQIVQSLNSNAGVYKNVHIEGQLSKVKRQIDIQLVKADEYDFIAFECKDYGRPLDVPIIEAFNTKLRDIKAKKGAILSNSPFSQAAENMASALEIDLLNLVDTSNKNIRAKIFASLLLSDASVKGFRLRLKTSSPQVTFPLEITKIIFMDEQGHKGTGYEIFAALWNDTDSSLSKFPGIYEYRPPEPENIRIIGLNGKVMIPEEIVFIYEVIEKHYVGQIEMIETQGLYNVKDHSFQTRSIQTVPIVAYEIEQNWPEISKEEVNKRREEGQFTMALGCSSILPSNPQ